MPINVESRLLSKSFKTEDYVFNPFHQPNEIYDQFTCHGGGDGNNDGVVDILDKNLADLDTDAFALDVNGDGIVNADDGEIIQQYIDGIITILPSWWNFLNKDEKLDWFTKMANIYTVDQKQYIDGDEDTRYVSGNFATEICIRMQGYNIELTDMLGSTRKELMDKYNESLQLNGRGNIPVYFVNRMRFDENGIVLGGHGMNGLLIGDNPLDFNDWIWYEPQLNQIFNEENFGIIFPNYSSIGIYKLENFGGYLGWGNDMPSRFVGDSPESTWAIEFNVDSEGNPSTGWIHPNLLTTKPTVSVEKESSVPIGFELKQNSPNPFNPTTTIRYTLSKGSDINITVFDIVGRTINHLYSSKQSSGSHTVQWNGTDNLGNPVSAGIYFYQLQTSNFMLTKKMVLMK